MQRKFSRTGKSLLYALIGSSLLYHMPLAYGAEEPADSTIAEKAQEQNEFTLEGVEVTAAKNKLDNGYVAKRSSAATKTDTPLEETARSISIITREQMNARGVTDMFDILSYTPGFSDMGYNNRGNRYGYYTLRGFGGTSFTDGLRSASGGFAVSNYDPYSFERVEVLRGPAGILYGTTNPGGVVNQVSKRPTAEPLREIRLQTGIDHELSGALDISGPVNDNDKLLFRLTALASEEDLPVDYSSAERQMIAPALTWRPNENTSLTLLAHYQKDDIKGDSYSSISQYQPGSLLYGYKSGTMFLGEPDYDRFLREDKQIGYILEHRFNDTWSVTQSARHSNIFTGMKALSVTSITDGIASRSNDYYKSDLSANLIDTHFTAKWSGGAVDHTTLLGFDYYNYNYDYYWFTGSAPSLNLHTLNYGQTVTTPTTISYLTDTDVKQTGWYLQDQLKFGKRWTATAGGRYDRYNSYTTNRLSGARTIIDQNAFTGRLGLVYDAGNGLFPYVSYDESFEGLAGSDRYGNSFDPTTGRQYELGIQYVPENSNARFTAAIFDLRQQNILTTDPLNESLGGSFSVQTGEIAAKGLELEATVAAFKNLNVTAAYTYMPDHKITKDNNPAKIGRRTSNVPRHSASLWIDTSAPGKEQKGWGLGGGLRYIGSRYNSANTRKASDVIVADAMIRYDQGEWRYALNAHNLFDKHYNMSPGNTVDGLDPGRIIRLTATRHW
ncbi:TonB-dependent siderophore receptor [Pelosinus propionicus]|uniref:Iron complex outermembrane recepter protein n=1 Tax=Pelosinus propionicus DSM 13327 TaxID=1123291 RepID=A0A1I4PZD6_9FIRM|nr:TonB-dependent siderophore receptor [Pelosinus propionicus]SFM32810.1 iron complex outermembrane recepter protein [Pelosinus propionicus DSM 13327]